MGERVLIREVGPMSDLAPEFPLAAGALAPLRAKAEAQGSGDFSPLWAASACYIVGPVQCWRSPPGGM